MSDANRAAEMVELLASQYEGMKTAAAILREIGSIDNHVMELRKKRDGLRVDVEKISDLILAERSRAADEIKEHQRRVEILENQHADLSAKIKKKVAEMLAQGEVDAAAIVQAGRDLAAKELAEHQAQMETLSTARDAQRERARIALEKTAEIEAKRDAAEAGYHKVLEAISALRG
jgi:predicted  nucleic acid-binding Zn-ribbon protein